jgi:hypothetical protein
MPKKLEIPKMVIKINKYCGHMNIYNLRTDAIKTIDIWIHTYFDIIS